MTFLNAPASRVALDNGATGATDVTGFGLLGHLGRMARESAVDVTIEVAPVPLIDGALELAEAGCRLRWSDAQRELGRRATRPGRGRRTDSGAPRDPQTSGGLVFGLARRTSTPRSDDLASSGHQACAIGRARRGTGRLLLR